MRDTDDKKEKFIKNFKESKGIVTISCMSSGISRQTYYNWYDDDEAFREEVEEVKELQIDFVEGKLLDLIGAGDSTSVIFYLKTRGKKRGYSQKCNATVQELAENQNNSDKTEINTGKAQNTENKSDKGKMKRLITRKVNSIKKLLEKQKKYSEELIEQIKIAAQLLVRTDLLSEEIFNESHQVVNVEISREGNTREVQSQKERLYLLYQREAQRALRALGMNVDSKERKGDDDSFNEFMKEFKEQ